MTRQEKKKTFFCFNVTHIDEWDHFTHRRPIFSYSLKELCKKSHKFEKNFQKVNIHHILITVIP